MKPRKVVAHLIGFYLPLTQTFIYQYLTKFTVTNPLVVAERWANLDLFPFENLAAVRSRTLMEKAFDKLVYWLAKRRPLQERLYREVLRKNKVALIHAHFGWSIELALALKQSLRLPLVITFYGVDISAFPKKPVWRELYMKAFKVADLFLVEGGQMRKKLLELGCPEYKVRVQHIGVDLDKIPFRCRQAPKPNNKVRLLMCGSFVEKKGIPYGIQAFAQVYQLRKDIELRIIGDGHLRSQIEDLIKTLKVEAAVKLLGKVSYQQFLQELEKADIFLAPSITDQDGDTEGGAPTVLLEAQAAGLPVVSTYHADIPEVVLDRESGFLVPEKDVAGLADKLLLLVKSPELWAKMGLRGRKHIETYYNINKEVAKLETVYSELI